MVQVQVCHYTHLLEMGLSGRINQAFGQCKGFNVSLCFFVPPVCQECNFVSPDAIVALPICTSVSIC